MRFRISGDLGGMIIVVMVGLIAASIVSGVLGWIKNVVFTKSPVGKSIFGILQAIVWIGAIALVILDLTNVYPMIRNILFSIL